MFGQNWSVIKRKQLRSSRRCMTLIVSYSVRYCMRRIKWRSQSTIIWFMPYTSEQTQTPRDSRVNLETT